MTQYRVGPGNTQIEIYECTVCSSGDKTSYLRCNRPDCTDGRDRQRPANYESRHPREDEVLPDGWELAAAYYRRKMLWLKWTVIFPMMLALVIAVFLLFTHKAHAEPRLCSYVYSMPRNCDSVKSLTNKFGERAAIWIARKCGATEADIEEAKACLKQR